jgi:2-isopropylmalate synthase
LPKASPSERARSRLARDLGAYRTVIADLELIDYKVRILNGGTKPSPRASSRSTDSSGDSLVHRRRLENVVDASFEGAPRSGRLQAAQAGVEPA